MPMTGPCQGFSQQLLPVSSTVDGILNIPPWIGIAYAFAGCRKDLNNTAYQVIPTASNMETQALSFCKAGAQGIVWYGWEDSTINVFPMSPQMKVGVQREMEHLAVPSNHPSLTSSTIWTALQ